MYHTLILAVAFMAFSGVLAEDQHPMHDVITKVVQDVEDLSNEMKDVKLINRNMANDISDLKTRNQLLENMNANLESEVEHVKHTNHDLATEMKTLKVKQHNLDKDMHDLRKGSNENMEHMKAEIVALKVENNNLQNKVEDLTAVSKNIEGGLAELTTDKGRINQKVVTLDDLNVKMQRKLGQVLSKLDATQLTMDSTSIVAFFARIGRYSLPGTPVPFNEVRLNLGGAYNNSTGQFVAPVSGLYQFSYGALANGNCGDVHVEVFLYLNDVMQSGSCSELYASAGTAVTLQLEAGDTVWIELNSFGCSDLDNSPPFNTFSGHLIYKLI